MKIEINISDEEYILMEEVRQIICSEIIMSDFMMGFARYGANHLCDILKSDGLNTK